MRSINNDRDDSADENQTVINCTQSDVVGDDTHSEDAEQSNSISDKSGESMSNLHSQSEGMSYRNVVDDYSTELAHLHIATHSSEDVAQVSISRNDNLAIHEEYEYNYQDEDSEHSEEYSEDEEENTSRLDYQFEQKHAHRSHTNSEAEYSEDLIKEISEEDLYQEDSNQHSKNYFEKTLTNMRIAFGSEQRVRENSVKTLEKMEFSVEGSNSGKKTEEKSSIFEKKSFQDFSLKKFTELMQVKNMKNFQNSMQKTFREYNKTKILSASDKKNGNNRTSSTPKKSKCISPRKFSMKDLELDRIGYEKMKENSEKKNKFISQIIGSSSSQNRRNNSSILYKSNLSIDKCRKEINMNDFSEEAANSVTHLGYKGLSPCKNNFSYEKERQQYKELLEPINQPQFDSPEPSKSMDSNPSSRKKISKTEREVIEELSVNETPYEDENVETVKLDSSRLRSQKRGLPMEERSCEKEETPKCTTTQRRIYRAEENCYTGEKYVLGDCFTDEKLHEMRLRNAVTSAKKINPLQIMKDLKSPATSSYISSAKKALIEEEGEFDEDDKIEFQLSAAREYNPREITGKENVRNNNNNILVERFSSVDEKDNALKNFVNANKFDFLEPDYNLLESPEKSNHKHSKSRSRTKEKRNNRSEGEPENLEV